MLKLLRYAPAFGSSALASFGLFFAGMLFLVLLFRSKKIVRQLELWKDRFRQCGVSPETYRGSGFSQPHVVYVRIPMLAVARKGLVSSTSPSSKSVKHSMFYVGSTTITLARRDAVRYRKFKQLFATATVQAEASVRHWFHRKSFFEYVSVALFPCSCAVSARVCENVFCRCGGLG